MIRVPSDCICFKRVRWEGGDDDRQCVPQGRSRPGEKRQPKFSRLRPLRVKHLSREQSQFGALVETGRFEMHHSSKSSWAYLFAVSLSIALSPASAAADTKTCVASHASAQREVKAGRLKQAAQLYTACGSDNACPEQLRAECSELLDKVKTTVPSVIFSALDGKGADVTNVKVYIDEALLIDGLDGRSVELDPGKYH